MIWTIILVWLIIGVIMDFIFVCKAPIMLAAGWALIPIAIIGLIIWPYTLYIILSDDGTGGGWI